MLHRFRPLLLALLFISVIAIGVNILAHLGYGITYVVSKSMPEGFYLILPPQEIKRYDIVEFRPPATTVQFLRKHNWGPQNGLLLKYVYGMPQDFVCNRNGQLSINGKNIAHVYSFYASGQKLPHRNFCAKLKSDEYLLLSNKTARSFDGRYFGPIKCSAIRGKARTRL